MRTISEIVKLIIEEDDKDIESIEDHAKRYLKQKFALSLKMLERERFYYEKIAKLLPIHTKIEVKFFYGYDSDGDDNWFASTDELVDAYSGFFVHEETVYLTLELLSDTDDIILQMSFIPLDNNQIEVLRTVCLSYSDRDTIQNWTFVNNSYTLAWLKEQSNCIHYDDLDPRITDNVEEIISRTGAELKSDFIIGDINLD